MKKPAFLKKIKSIHFVGIKGVGMTALACCSQDLDIQVGGSDMEEVFVTDDILKKRNIKWKIGFDKKNLKKRPDLVITTGAHGGLNNIEVLEANRLKVPVLTHAEALGKFMEGKDGISVCGVGGKTTTSSIIATILDQAGKKPSWAIGVAEINPLGPGGRYNGGSEFVAEADEYANSPGLDNRPRFSFQKPKIIVVTNVEYDHPDVYKDISQTKDVFRKFFETLPRNGLLVACADNPNTRETIKSFSGNVQTYGFSPKADWGIEKTYFGSGQTIFNLFHKGVLIEDIKIQVPGKYNVLNSAAAFAAGTFLGLDAKIIRRGLEKFAGARRRFEYIGEVRRIKLYDDYAYHPSEIKEVLTAAKKWFPQNRIIVIFQPHTFSRTKAFFHEFGKAFLGADMVVVSDIYASSREKDDLGVNSKLLVQEIGKSHRQAFFKPGQDAVIDFLKKQTQSGDIIITLGAGSIFQWHKNILKSLRR